MKHRFAREEVDPAGNRQLIYTDPLSPREKYYTHYENGVAWRAYDLIWEWCCLNVRDHCFVEKRNMEIIITIYDSDIIPVIRLRFG